MSSGALASTIHRRKSLAISWTGDRNLAETLASRVAGAGSGDGIDIRALDNAMGGAGAGVAAGGGITVGLIAVVDTGTGAIGATGGTGGTGGGAGISIGTEVGTSTITAVSARGTGENRKRQGRNSRNGSMRTTP